MPRSVSSTAPYEEDDSASMELCSAGANRKSLNVLAKDFMNMIKNSPSGCLNIQEVSDMLQVKQKRRIYDITNVLEGIGLITKRSKNVVQWREKFSSRLNGVDNQAQLDAVTEKLKYVERMCVFARKNITHMMMQKQNRVMAYVTRDDLLQCYGDSSTLAVKGHEKAERLPVMLNNTIIMGRGLKISSKDRPLDVRMATKEGQALIQTKASDDLRTETGGGKRKSKLVEKSSVNSFSSAVPEHFEVEDSESDKKKKMQRFQEYRKTANLLLNYRTKNPIRDRRMRLKNYYQAELPFIKLADKMSSNYQFSMHDTEGICDLFDIPTPSKPEDSSLVADNEELSDDAAAEIAPSATEKSEAADDEIQDEDEGYSQENKSVEIIEMADNFSETEEAMDI